MVTHRLATLALAATLSLALIWPTPALPPGPLPGAQPSGLPAAEARPSGGRLAAPDGLSPQVTRELLQSVVPPARDEADLVRRFKYACGTPAADNVSLYREETVGKSRPFWVLDEPNRRFFQVQATLRHASPHLLFYVQEGAQVSAEALAASAAVFEEQTYPMLRRYFGDLPEESRITVFNGRVPGVGGYFSASDLYPRAVNPFSNERVMVFMSLDATRPGTPAYDAVLAHEAQHFVHWVVKPQQDSWVNEGASELAMAVAGYDQSSAARSFLNNPGIQLNAWAQRPSESLPHYGGGYLMLEYFAQRLGGYEHVKDLIASPGSSVHTFDSYFAQRRSRMRFDDLFRDFVIANLINDRTVADGRFGYENLSGRVRVQETHAGLPAASSGFVRPYGTRYIEFQPDNQGGDLELTFSGARETRLFAGPPHSGRAQWWGNAADEIESTLTREFDLTEVQHATLTFAAWFDIERDYDYAGVAVSTDAGCSWQTISGGYTTDSNPTGQNLGHGFTGRSGGGETPIWIDETMDLTPFVGQQILLRVFYVTDQSYHGSGFAVDDVSIPEIGFADDAETDRGWEARGFLRAVNATALDWAVQVVAFTDHGPQIMQVPLTADGATGAVQGTVTVRRFGQNVHRVVAAVSPLVPVTLEAAEFRLDAQLR
ncbi:MAG: hypothetical protein ACRDI2_02645 [Chloroflexota bacterium]